MEKTYERINWENYPSVVTPINEKNLNKMDQALDEVDNRVIGLDTAKLDKATANTMVKDVSFDENTGIFTITYLNGTVKKVDTALEKIATNFTYNRDTQKLLLTLVDGTEQEVDLSSLISQYEFTDSDFIAFTVGSDGKVTATIKAGSITEDMLQPNFLADVKVEVEKAKTYSNSASNSSNEAKQYRDEAEQFRNEASAFVPEGYDELVHTVEENTVKIDTLLEKAGLQFNNTAKGSNIHLTDSAEANVVALELYGKTEQNAYTGKNLLDCRGFTETTNNGVTFTPVYDSNGNLLYVNANGTATNGNASFNIKSHDYALSSGTYILSGCPSGGDLYTYRLGTNIDGTNKYDVGNGLTIDLSEDKTEKSIWINVFNGKTVSNLKFYPMISIEGGEYEPYVGGIPSPSPSYPQEIKSVVLNTIKTHGKNLLDDTDISSWYKPAESSVYRKVFKLKPNTEYTISQIKDSDSGSALIFILSGIVLDLTPSTSENGCTVGNSRTVTSSINGYITIGLYENSKGYCQLEEGSTATDYQPYQSTEITLSEPIELNGFNGVYDVVESGKITRKIKRRRLLRSDGWGAHANGWIYTMSISDFKYGDIHSGTTYSPKDAFCTHLVYENNAKIITDKVSQGITMWYDTSHGGYRVAVYLPDMTCDEWVTFLDENEVYLLYELATPTTEELKTDFTALKTFYPETHVSNDADCDMSITYTADAKNYIDNKIALLTTALYNNI